MNTNLEVKRPFVTQYFDSADASGKNPVSFGYAASLSGARKNMTVRIVLGQYRLATVSERVGRRMSQPVCIIRKTTSGLNIKDI